MKIPIKIGDDVIYLQSGENCFELAEKRLIKNKTTEQFDVTFVPYKYFTTLESAFQALLTMKVRVSDAVTLEELKLAITKARKELSAEWNLK